MDASTAVDASRIGVTGASVDSISVCGIRSGPTADDSSELAVATVKVVGAGAVAGFGAASTSVTGRKLTNAGGTERSEDMLACCAETVRVNATRQEASNRARRRREKRYLVSMGKVSG